MLNLKDKYMLWVVAFWWRLVFNTYLALRAECFVSISTVNGKLSHPNFVGVDFPFTVVVICHKTVTV